MDEQPWSDFEEEPVHSSGRRCGLQWTPWMGDFFTSWSPRNGNNNAEGPWDHWVDLALKILADPFTQLVRPEAYRTEPAPLDLHTETNRGLTTAELIERFPERREQLERQQQWIDQYRAKNAVEENDRG